MTSATLQAAAQPISGAEPTYLNVRQTIGSIERLLGGEGKR